MNNQDRFLGLIEDSIKAHWDFPALTDHQGVTYYYKDMAAEMARLHLLLEHAGVRKGDRVALIGRNSSRWVIAFFGILTYGAVATPILHDFHPENVHHIVCHSESKVLLAASASWEKLSADAMPDLTAALLLEDWSVVLSRHPGIDRLRERLETDFAERYSPLFTADSLHVHIEQPDEMAILNYTSGTTGYSKGVMLPYRSLWSNTRFAADHLSFIKAGDHFVCMLPMAHMYGLAFEIMNGINKGCHIHFLPRVPNPKVVIDTFTAVRPRLIIAVPLIIEKIVRTRIFPEINKPTTRLLRSLPGIGRLIDRRICKALSAAFGSDFSEIVIGGAAINKEVEQFLHRIGFRYTVGYGMTECGPLISYEYWKTYRPGSVGRAVDRMEVRIDSPDPENTAGEIQVRSMNVMLGYYKNPDATAAAMTPDGWLKTGDLGVIDRDGFIFIRGRSKTMILSSNGQNIYPEEIESILGTLPYVTESLIVQRPEGLVALILPDRDRAEKDGLDAAALQATMTDNLRQLNSRIPKYCTVSSVELRDEPFEKTPKQSIKRYLYK